MQIKAIGYNSVKTLVERCDIQKFDIPLSAWKEGEGLCGEFLNVLLAEIYRQTGISFTDCDVLAEIIEGIGEEYYIVMTKAEKSEMEVCPIDEKAPAIYRLERLQHLFPVAAVFLRDINRIQSSLYQYRGAFYLVLRLASEIGASGTELYACRIEEFATRVARSTYFFDLLLEYGRKIGGDTVLNLFIPSNLSATRKGNGFPADGLG